MAPIVRRVDLYVLATISFQYFTRWQDEKVNVEGKIDGGIWDRRFKNELVSMRTLLFGSSAPGAS